MNKKTLKKKVKELEFQNSILKTKLEDCEITIQKLHDKIDLLGTSVDTPTVNSNTLRTITVNAQTWGHYMAIPTTAKPEEIKAAKSELAAKLVKSLMDQNLIQFIFNPDDDQSYMLRFIAAKIFVVPWDQTIPQKQTILLGRSEAP